MNIMDNIKYVFKTRCYPFPWVRLKIHKVKVKSKVFLIFRTCVWTRRVKCWQAAARTCLWSSGTSTPTSAWRLCTATITTSPALLFFQLGTMWWAKPFGRNCHTSMVIWSLRKYRCNFKSISNMEKYYWQLVGQCAVLGEQQPGQDDQDVGGQHWLLCPHI